MVSLKIDFGKRDFVWIGLVVVLLGIGFVIAYGGSEPSVMGHSAGEIGLDGAVIAFNLASCPLGWQLANGTGGTPDLRGTFIRGLDEGRGLDAGRVLASYQADDLRSHRHGLDGTDNTAGSEPRPLIAGTNNRFGYTEYEGGSETRPVNVALIYCIKV